MSKSIEPLPSLLPKHIGPGLTDGTIPLLPISKLQPRSHLLEFHGFSGESFRSLLQGCTNHPGPFFSRRVRASFHPQPPNVIEVQDRTCLPLILLGLMRITKWPRKFVFIVQPANKPLLISGKYAHLHFLLSCPFEPSTKQLE